MKELIKNYWLNFTGHPFFVLKVRSKKLYTNFSISYIGKKRFIFALVKMNIITTSKKLFATLLLIGLLAGCEENSSIVTDVNERDANEIIVFLASKGIPSNKMPAKAAGPGATGGTAYSIMVERKQITEALAILNQNGLPRKKTTDLLTLFQKQGMMSSEKEETVRYQAGLAESIASTISLIDGVIDAKVQIAFPQANASGDETKERVTASVYVKHQGILDDPNSHLITKIKRIVSASINNLDINDVTVISDRSRFSDVTIDEKSEEFAGRGRDLISIWGVMISQQSAPLFRAIFSLFAIIGLGFILFSSWLLWKMYPVLRQNGFGELLRIAPLQPTPRATDVKSGEDETT